MRVQRLAWGLGAGLLLAAGALAMACGDDSQGGGTLPGGGSDATTDRGSSNGDSSTNKDTSTGTDGGGEAAAADCGVYRVFHDPDAGPFCRNQVDGAAPNCTTGQTCCQQDREAGAPSTCGANAAACTAVNVDAGGFNAIWECDEKDDCPQGQSCCFNTTPIQDNQCATKFFSGNTQARGTTCKAACGAGEATVCGQQADCTTGTCTGFSVKGKQIGYCK